jgi:hypothetical protein
MSDDIVLRLQAFIDDEPGRIERGEIKEPMLLLTEALREIVRLRARLVITRAMIERAARAYNETLYDDIRGPVERWVREVLEGALQEQPRPPSTLGQEYPEGDGALFGDK